MTAGRCFISAVNTATWRGGPERQRKRTANPCVALVMSAQRIPFHAVFCAPFVSHLAANFPQLREEFVPHPFFEDFHWPALQRFRTKPNRAVNQLHVLVPEFLE